jgi:uncharacterized protein with PQ loop repeat
MISAEVVGFIAGALGMFFGLPQALRVRRLGHGRGVSLISWLQELLTQLLSGQSSKID